MRKYMSILLCICMLLSAFPTLALAEGEMCENHPQHTEDCGYAPAFAGSACKHELGEHDDACYQSVTACLHQHGNDGCTYTPAKDAVICTHVCDASVCGYVAPRPENPCACQPAEDGTFAHVENCGYVPADPGVPCNFQHGVHPACACVPAQPESGECNHVCSTENGCITSVLSCTHAAAHDENCGYAPATEGSPCTHCCELCKPTTPDGGDDTATTPPDVPVVYPGCAHHNHDENCGGLLNNCTYVCEVCVAEIQQMVNALPDYVTPENQSAVEAALTAIQQRYIKISTKAMGKINFAKFGRLASLLTMPPDLFSFSIQKSSIAAGEGLLCNFTFVNIATGQPVSAITADGKAVSCVSLVANGAGGYYYLPAGTYTIYEQVEGNWTLSTTVNGAAAPGNTFTGAAGNSYVMTVWNGFSPSVANAKVEFIPEFYTYDGTEHEAPEVVVIFEDMKLSEGTDYTVEYSREDGVDESNKFIDAGVVKVTITGKGDYVGSQQNAEFEIKPKKPVEGNDYTVPTDLTATYGDTLSSISLPAGFAWETPDMLVGSVGTQTHKVIYTPENKNFAPVTGIEVNVNVKKAVLDVTKPAAEANLVYNGEEQVLAYAPNDVYVYVGESLDNADWGTEAKATNAGTYKVWYKSQYSEDSNYEIPAPAYIEVTIAKAPIIVQAEDASKVYGEEDPIFSLEYKKGEVFAGDKLIFSVKLEPENVTEAGEYAIIPSLSVEKSIGAENYDVKCKSGTFTINPAAPEASHFDFTPPAEKIATGDTVSADIAVKPEVNGMGAVTVSYYNDKGETATPNAAGTYIVKIDVAAGKNYTAVQGLGDAVWTFTLEKDPADTANTEKVKDITKDNVKPENKTDLEKAKEDLEKALEDNKDKYTDEQKKDIQADIDRIDEALKALPPAAAQYIITYGNHGYWYKGSYYALGFKCDGPYAKFLGITIDGLPVDRAYYTAFEGSTVVSLSPQLLNLLPVGPHTITFAYTDGSATGYFYVLKAPINAVMTGDDSDGSLMALTLSISLMGLALSLGALKRRKTQ